MGTRHLTAVIKDGKHIVAQYGQWDGYPSGQGATILAFLNETPLHLFEQQLDKCHFLSEGERDRRYKARGLPESGWMDMEHAEIYSDEFPYFSRDHGADILKMILNSKDDPIDLHDSWSFGADSLFCEYAYVLDMDNKQLEVYKGFNSSGSAKGRFKDLEDPDNERRIKDGQTPYDPVTLVKTYSFANLPTIAELEADVDPEEDE